MLLKSLNYQIALVIFWKLKASDNDIIIDFVRQKQYNLLISGEDLDFDTSKTTNFFIFVDLWERENVWEMGENNYTQIIIAIRSIRPIFAGRWNNENEQGRRDETRKTFAQVNEWADIWVRFGSLSVLRAMAKVQILVCIGLHTN